jgi:maltose O-acetyltransferase
MNRLKKILRKIYRFFFKPNPVLRKLKKQGLVVGKNFQMFHEVDIDGNHCWHITIGDDVTLAPRVQILAHDASTKFYLNYTKIGKVSIGNRVFVGAASIILPGVKIGDDVVIGAGSVVAHDISSGAVAVGIPAKVVGTIDEFLAKKKGEMEIYPCFGEKYTTRKKVTKDMKTEMNEKMKDRFGYII